SPPQKLYNTVPPSSVPSQVNIPHQGDWYGRLYCRRPLQLFPHNCTKETDQHNGSASLPQNHPLQAPRNPISSTAAPVGPKAGTCRLSDSPGSNRTVCPVYKDARYLSRKNARTLP